MNKCGILWEGTVRITITTEFILHLIRIAETDLQFGFKLGGGCG